MAGISHRLLCVALALVCLAALCLDSAEAGRRKKARAVAKPCKYSKVKSECDPVYNVKNMTFTLKKGDPEVCPQTKVLAFSCKKKEGCVYNKKGMEMTDCDPHTNRRSLTKPVVEGSPDHCPETHIKVKRCKSSGKDSKRARGKKNKWRKKMERKNKKKQRKNKQRKMNKKQRRRENRRKRKQMAAAEQGALQTACRYEKLAWSPCTQDPHTGAWTKQREAILSRGDSTNCRPMTLVTKACKKRPGLEGCRYTKGEWGRCDDATLTWQRTLTPVTGSDPKCVQTTETQECRYKAALTAPKTNKCRYKMGEWGLCNARTNTKTALMRLKSGDPNVCPRAKEFTRKCKPECKFGRGVWSECDSNTGLATRTDPLTKGSLGRCNGSREVHRKCKKACEFELGDWSPCDPVTKLMTRVNKLVGGGPKCQKEIRPEDFTESKPCEDVEGAERCSFGSWGEFGACTNGVAIRKRQVFTDDIGCERLGADMTACDMGN